MSIIVNTHEAKSRLSELIRLAESGEEVIVAHNGVYVVKLVPWGDGPPVRKPGAWKGQVWMADDFDDDLSSMFEGDD
jgi:prevent-host-death family protein